MNIYFQFSYIVISPSFEFLNSWCSRNFHYDMNKKWQNFAIILSTRRLMYSLHMTVYFERELSPPCPQNFITNVCIYTDLWYDKIPTKYIDLKFEDCLKMFAKEKRVPRGHNSSCASKILSWILKQLALGLNDVILLLRDQRGSPVYEEQSIIVCFRRSYHDNFSMTSLTSPSHKWRCVPVLAC